MFTAHLSSSCFNVINEKDDSQTQLVHEEKKIPCILKNASSFITKPAVVMSSDSTKNGKIGTNKIPQNFYQVNNCISYQLEVGILNNVYFLVCTNFIVINYLTYKHLIVNKALFSRYIS